MSSTVLAYPDPQLRFVLDTDASEVSIGAVLAQPYGDKEGVIAGISRTLNKEKQNTPQL